MKKHIIILSFLFSSISIINAQQWKALNSGTEGGLNVVYALTQYDSNLVAGGWFDSVGGVFTPNLAQWNGVKWDTIGSSSSPYNIGVPVYAECVYKDSLIVAGNENTCLISEWNGAVWLPITPGSFASFSSPRIGNFAVYQSKLYASGVIENNDSVNIIITWNGTSWDTLPTEVIKKDAYPSTGPMVVYNGNLYVGGNFDTAGNIPAKNIAMWNGTNWSAVGDGFNGPVGCLYVSNGTLYAGGLFDSSGSQRANDIAYWNGSKWNPLGLGIQDGGVNALVQYSSLLCVAGSFDSAGGQRANNIAFWDGTNWSTLSSGVTGTGSFPTSILALSVYKGALIAAGSFDTAGGIPANNIAEWLSPLGISQIDNTSINVKVYPNPSNGIFQLEIKNEKLGINNAVEIYNMLGEKVYSQSKIQTSTFNIDINNQPNGVYLYRILSQNDDLLREGKIVIQK